jgi:hypothetical protein
VETLQQVTVPAFIGGHKNVILLIHSGTIFNSNIADHFRAKPEPWFLGAVNQSTCPDGWGAKYVTDLWHGVDVQLLPTVPEGYYLFLLGHACGFHSGKPLPSNDGPPPEGALLSVLSILAAGVRDHFQGAKDAIEHFERILNAPQPIPLPPTPSRPTWDPYKVLGIGPNSSKEEASRAWKQLRKAFDPTRVDDMAEELRKFANDKSVELNRAWAEVQKLKGW